MHNNSLRKSQITNLNRPISKLASANQMQEDLGAQNRNVFNIHEDSSTKSTQQLVAEVELQNMSNDYGKKHVVVIAGGMSCEREVSLVSGDIATKSLMRLGYRVTLIDMGYDIASILLNVNPDIVFNALHGTYGEDGCISGVLNILQIPYTQSGVLASALSFDKLKSKEIFNAYQILQPKYLCISQNQHKQMSIDPMTRPYVIKPINQGSSIGVHVIFEEDDFKFQDYKFEYGDSILIEEYIKGREMQVAVLNGKALGALEVKLLKKRFYDYETKYTDGFADHIMPANLSKTHYTELLSLAEKVNFIVGATGLTRVEFMFDEISQKFYVLEINTHPGMTPTSICPEIAEYAGINFDNLIENMLSTAKFEK